MKLSHDESNHGPFSQVLIYGIGILTPAGASLEEVCATAPPVVGEPTHLPWIRAARAAVGSTVERLPNRKLRRMLSRGVHLGLVAAIAALADAELTRFPCESSRLGVFASGFMCLEDIAHVHTLLKQLREQGQEWRSSFGKLATERLPPLMLLRCLPNAAFCHTAQYALAKGYNASLLTGCASGLDCLRQAARAIATGRLDAALVVCCDSPLSWEIVDAVGRVCERDRTADMITLGEAGCALYLEREGLHPGRAQHAYARYLSGCARQSCDGITHFKGTAAISAPQGLAEAIDAAVFHCLSETAVEEVRYLHLGAPPVRWWEDAEHRAGRQLKNEIRLSANDRSGYSANCSGAIGLAELCYRLSRESGTAAGLAVRASPTGQCSAVLLKTAAV